MSEYIKREDAYRRLTEYYHHTRETQHESLRIALIGIPSADVAPVRHGHWYFYDGKWYCSVCGYCMEWCLSKPIEDWCGSCGARMDAKE